MLMTSHSITHMLQKYVRQYPRYKHKRERMEIFSVHLGRILRVDKENELLI